MAGMSMAEMVRGVLSNQPSPSPYAAAGVDVSSARYEDSLPLARIDPWPGNRELSEDAVARLAGDIGENGVLQPVLVRPRAYGRYQLVAGHHRVEAVRLLAAADPSDERWRGIKALVLEMGDEEAERAVLSTNVYMIPMWTPEERGAEWMRLSEKAEGMRRGDPERYRGVRTNEIVLELAREAGIETSAGSIIREKRAYRESAAGRAPFAPAGLAPGWEAALAAGEISAAQARRIALEGPGEQERALGAFRGARRAPGRLLDAWLARRDPARRDAMASRALSRALDELAVAAALAGSGFKPAGRDVEEALASLAAISGPAGPDGGR